MGKVFKEGHYLKVDTDRLKLNYRMKVFYYALNFLPWEFLLIKKLDFEKTKVTWYKTFKTDIINVVIVFFDF